MNRTQLAAIVLFAILVGVVFRLYHFDRKVVWSDKLYTQLHVAGLTESDVVAKSLDFRDVLRANLSSGGIGNGRGYDATVRSMIVKDPHHSPLYYLMERSWVSVFGDSILIERLLSALFGIAVLPSAFLLARELSSSRRFAWTLGPSPELLRLVRASTARSGAHVRCIDLKNNCSRLVATLLS